MNRTKSLLYFLSFFLFFALAGHDWYHVLIGYIFFISAVIVAGKVIHDFFNREK